MDSYVFYPLVMGLMGLIAVLAAGAVWLHRRRAGTRQDGSSRGRKAQAEELDTVLSWEPTATRLLSGAEREAYVTLRAALPEHIVLAQVPLARFLKVPTRNSYSEWMRRAGSMCVDLVVCDGTSKVIAAVEIREPLGREKERVLRRQERMDRVLTAAGIPVHVWLDGALPGPAVARETVLGGSIAFTTKSGATLVDTSVARNANVVPMDRTKALDGLAVHEAPFDIDLELELDSRRGEPTAPISAWFPSDHSAPVSLGSR